MALRVAKISSSFAFTFVCHAFRFTVTFCNLDFLKVIVRLQVVVNFSSLAIDLQELQVSHHTHKIDFWKTFPQ